MKDFKKLAAKHGLAYSKELDAFARDIVIENAVLCKTHRVYARIDSGEKYLAPWIVDGDRHDGVLFSEAILATLS
jgi:hypothetical protein